MNGRIVAVLGLIALVAACGTPGGFATTVKLMGAAADGFAAVRLATTKGGRVAACVAELESFGYDVYLAEDLPAGKERK